METRVVNSKRGSSIKKENVKVEIKKVKEVIDSKEKKKED
jgi:hypothetical protein